MSARLRRILLGLAAAIALAVAQQAGLIDTGGDVGAPEPPSGVAFRPPGSAPPALERALAERASGVMMTVEAKVLRRLSDDRDGSRHQRFLIDVGEGRTVLVAHNIDLADRVPLEQGDLVRVRGQFEWNEKGGVLHWTHHDPRGRHPGGWIEHEGRRIE